MKSLGWIVHLIREILRARIEAIPSYVIVSDSLPVRTSGTCSTIEFESIAEFAAAYARRRYGHRAVARCLLYNLAVNCCLH